MNVWLHGEYGSMRKLLSVARPLANVNKLRSYVAELQVCSTSARNFKFD